MSSWIEVSEARLQANFRVLVEAAGAETDVLAVVKANAYEHGAEVCSVALARAGAQWFGVAEVAEGVRVRRALDAAGFADARILVMLGATSTDVAAMAGAGLIPVVWTGRQVQLLGQSAKRVHLEVDTGMGRQGVRPGAELDAVLDQIAAAGLELDGVMTHFCAAEVAGSAKTRDQERQFAQAVAQVQSKGFAPKWVHAGSSSSVDDPQRDTMWLAELAKTVGARAMVRTGIALYGYCLPIEGEAGARIRGELQPVMTWKTRVLNVREGVVGETIGYNATFTAEKPMRLALMPVGYSDGLRRELSSTNAKPGGWVMIRGERAAIVGRISMNLTMVDVSAIEGARGGDEVVVLGDGVTADDHARIAGTISYEILCGVRGGTAKDL
ncbi:MAG TPA: alanine racemase [Acidobacteriaceae bacterium]